MRPWKRSSSEPRRPTRSCRGSEDGSASVEFITAGVLLLVPFVYLVLALAAVQGAAFAVEGAARQAARVYVRAETEADARDRADLAVRYALADFGVDEANRGGAGELPPRPRHLPAAFGDGHHRGEGDRRAPAAASLDVLRSRVVHPRRGFGESAGLHALGRTVTVVAEAAPTGR